MTPKQWKLLLSEATRKEMVFQLVDQLKAIKQLSAEIERLTQELAEVTRKGKSLCFQNGNLMIEHHDLKKENIKLREALRELQQNTCAELCAGDRMRHHRPWCTKAKAVLSPAKESE